MSGDIPPSVAPRPAPWRGRRRTEQPRDAWVHIRVTADERAALAAAAERAEMPLGPYVVSAALNAPQRRAARRISVDRLALAQALGWLGKAGSNLNQIARVLNSGGDRPAAEIADAISVIRDAGLAISATLRGRRP